MTHWMILVMLSFNPHQNSSREPKKSAIEIISVNKIILLSILGNIEVGSKRDKICDYSYHCMLDISRSITVQIILKRSAPFPDHKNTAGHTCTKGVYSKDYKKEELINQHWKLFNRYQQW